MTVKELRDFLALTDQNAEVLDQFGEPITGFRTEESVFEYGVRREVLLESGK